MNSEKDGGPAFPHGDPTNGGDPGSTTLRDYFAAQAMLMKFGPVGSTTEMQMMATYCYRMADAMLVERAK